MGGDTISSMDDDDMPIINQHFPDRFTEIPTSWPGGLGGRTPEETESVFREDSDARSLRNLVIEANEKRVRHVYAQVYKTYDEIKHRAVNLEMAKSKISSYTPGSFVKNIGGMTMSNFKVPKTTTLVLIGPKGSGKSSLVNRISRVFEDDKFAPERAQVTCNSSIGDQTFFLQEYMIPRSSTSFCLYDTRSFSNDLYENLEMTKRWMTKGVRHGEFVKSSSDNSSLVSRINRRSRQDKVLTYERRRVDFVIFVVNGLSVLKCVNSDGEDSLYTQTVSEIFSSPFLSFKDHKPAIAITHGDLLSLSERARVRVFLGELLGVHPSKQTFDIPDDTEATTELTIVDLVRYALEHADRNLPCKSRPMITKGCIIRLWAWLLLLLALGVFEFTLNHNGLPSMKVDGESRVEQNVIIKNVSEGSIPKASLEMKKVDINRIRKPRVGKKKKVGGEPNMEIDWKTIRHLWY